MTSSKLNNMTSMVAADGWPSEFVPIWKRCRMSRSLVNFDATPNRSTAEDEWNDFKSFAGFSRASVARLHSWEERLECVDMIWDFPSISLGQDDQGSKQFLIRGSEILPLEICRALHCEFF